MISAFLLDTSSLGNQDTTLPGNARIRLPTRTQRSTTPARKPSNSPTTFPQHTNSNDALGLLGDEMVTYEHIDASRNASFSNRSKLWCAPPPPPNAKLQPHFTRGVRNIAFWKSDGIQFERILNQCCILYVRSPNHSSVINWNKNKPQKLLAVANKLSVP